MKIKELRKYIEDLDGDAEMLIESSDHHYAKGEAHFTDVAYNTKYGEYSEYYDEKNMSPGDKKVKGLVVM